MSTEWKRVIVGLVLVAVGGALALTPSGEQGAMGALDTLRKATGVLVVLAGVYLVYQA